MTVTLASSKPASELTI